MTRTVCGMDNTQWVDSGVKGNQILKWVSGETFVVFSQSVPRQVDSMQVVILNKSNPSFTYQGMENSYLRTSGAVIEGEVQTSKVQILVGDAQTKEDKNGQ